MTLDPICWSLHIYQHCFSYASRGEALPPPGPPSAKGCDPLETKGLVHVLRAVLPKYDMRPQPHGLPPRLRRAVQAPLRGDQGGDYKLH
ncbi:MAG: hypothetical protein Alpg2KO_14660 [Alphaproteobacteria bacterium]